MQIMKITRWAPRAPVILCIQRHSSSEHTVSQFVSVLEYTIHVLYHAPVHARNDIIYNVIYSSGGAARAPVNGGAERVQRSAPRRRKFAILCRADVAHDVARNRNIIIVLRTAARPTRLL